MKVYDSTKNSVDEQVQTGASVLFMHIEKTPTANFKPKDLFTFFGEDEINTADSIQVLYNSQAGQRAVISNLNILPLLLMSTVSPNHLKAVKDADGNITKVFAALRIGFDGALPLSQNNYLSVTTGFKNLSNLRIYAIDGRKTANIIKYESNHFDPKQERTLALVNGFMMAVPKGDADMPEQLVARFTSLGDMSIPQYTANFSEAELAFLATEANDIQAQYGVLDSVTESTAGEDYTYPLGFRATETMSGGYCYDVLSVVDFSDVKFTFPRTTRVYVARNFSLNEMPA
jgi:hypothetical protein